ncbi:hypothetical protein BBJ29_007957 [Phytophthora kernoviae]|uniref:Uncharacterized protein n=1 Tax=Phytophthora kernoviae TaxID=325452 RepID=A0A421G8A7_9STRA|nr:hypothetical protein BBJ29_007957 [Phytophthora kernoviae]
MDCREEDAKRVAKSRALLTLFFRFGANLDALSNTGKTALHYVTSDGLYEAAEILLDAGATVDIQDQYGQSPLHSAVKERSLLVTNLLHALVSIRGRLNFAGAVLLEAAEVEAVEIIRLLVEGGYASLDYQNDEGETAMHLAIAKGSIPMVEALGVLDTAGLSLHTVTNCGDSCFHFAARFAAAHELEVLLKFWRQRDVDDRGAVLDKPDASGATPLFVAATATDSNGEFGDRHEKMELLLANGAAMSYPVVGRVPDRR